MPPLARMSPIPQDIAKHHRRKRYRPGFLATSVTAYFS